MGDLTLTSPKVTDVTSRMRPRALVTLPDVAEPADSGRRIRSRNTLDGLALHFDLDLVVPIAIDRAPMSAFPSTLPVHRLLNVPSVRPTPVAAVVASARRRIPFSLANEDWQPVRSALSEWLDHNPYDLVWFGAISHQRALGGLPRSTATVTDIDDLQSAKWSRYLESRAGRRAPMQARLRRSWELPRWRRVERAVGRSSDLIVVSDPDDATRCARLGVNNVHVVPNSYADPGLRPIRSPRTPPFVAFVANYGYAPNIDAARELASQILPALRESIPDMRLHLIGKSADVVGDLATLPGVKLIGRVDDVSAHLTDAIATLLPIRYGGGTRLKALEAFALGVPVVGTPFAVAGLGATPEVTYLASDTPREFAQNVTRLLEEPELALRLRLAARSTYEERFTTAASSAAITSLLRRLPLNSHSPNTP